MTRPGWFPDPGGAPGRLRWWDGHGWTSQLRPGPPAAHPPAGTTPPTGPRPPGSRRNGGLVLLGALVLVLVVVAVVVLRPAGGGPGPGPGPDPTSSPDLCLPSAPATAGPQPDPVAGRISSGRMSVPWLGQDWDAVRDDRVPFGRGMIRQQMSVDDDPPWIVSLNVGTMVAGDGFLAPEQGVHLVMPCLIAEYYRDVVVSREDVVDEAVTIDGRPGWVLESELAFDIDGLDFDSERLILIIVDLDDGTAGAVVVDLPAVALDREPELRAALADIRVAP